MVEESTFFALRRLPSWQNVGSFAKPVKQGEKRWASAATRHVENTLHEKNRKLKMLRRRSTIAEKPQ